MMPSSPSRGTQEPFVIALRGEWDTLRYPEVLEAVRKVPEHVDSILLDLSETTVLDSTVLGTLLLAKREWDRRGIVFATFTGNPNVNRLLSMANVADRLNVFKERDKALFFLAFRSSPSIGEKQEREKPHG
jgi:anti-anti-sigma factor